MKLVYGAYEHSDNEAFATFSIAPFLSPRGQRLGRAYSVVIRGALLADGATKAEQQTSLTNKITALESAYSESQVFVIKDNAGADTPHKVDPANTVDGVQAVVQWSDGNGQWNSSVEYANRRSYQIFLTAKEFTDPNSDGIWSWKESITINGGLDGTRVALTPAEGAVTIQKPTENSARRIIQRGSAIGFSSAPTPPVPSFPLLDGEPSGVTYLSPEFVTPTGAMRMYGVAWQYSGFLLADDAVPFLTTGPSS